MDSKLEELVARGVNLPALPTVGAELIAMAQQPIDSIDIEKLSALVTNDPSLSARMLKLANSPFFGATHEVTSVRTAVMRLGLSETVDFLNFYLLHKVMPRFPTTPHFNNRDFWRHCWATASIARHLCNPSYLIKSLPGELYLSGLFHELGKALMAAHLPDEFEQALLAEAKGERSLAEAEHDLIGVNHASLAAYLLRNWHLPIAIIEAVQYHLEPGYAPEESRERAGLVQYASLIAHQWSYAHEPLSIEPLAQSWLVESTRGPLAEEATQTALLKELDATVLQRSRAVFGIVSSEPESEQATEKASAPRAKAPAPKPKKGFWGKLFGK